MKETKKTAIAALALAFILPSQACKAQNTVKQGSFPASSLVRIEQDKGSLTIEPGASGTIEYTVEFSGRFWSRGTGTGRVEEDGGSGRLGIYAGSDARAKTVVKVPKDARLKIGFGDGTLEIGPLSGRINASVANGTLTFQSAAVPAGKCVGARALNGTVETPWGERVGAGAEVRPCANPVVELEVINGTLEVK